MACTALFLSRPTQKITMIRFHLTPPPSRVEN
jgi:hypothetical protein